jgi:hypothetical protein
VEYGAAFALALWNLPRAEVLADDLEGRFPEDPQSNSFMCPNFVHSLR